jgi:hypothetical protein
MYKDRLEFFNQTNRNILANEQLPITFGQALRVLRMGLLTRLLPDEKELLESTNIWSKDIANSKYISKRQKNSLSLVNGGFLKKFYLFIFSEYPKRVIYFFKSHFPSLILLYRKIKYA